MSVRSDVLDFLRRPDEFSVGLAPGDAAVWLRGLTHLALPRIAASGERTLRPAQERAWRGMADARASLVLGPPGTGKTHLLAWLATGSVHARREEGLPARIFVTAFTRNAAGLLIETIRERMHAHLADPPRAIFLGNAPPAGLSPAVEHVPTLAGSNLDAAVGALDDGAVVVGASIWTLNRLLASGRVPGGDGATAPLFDLVLIDEASQMVLGHGLMALAGLAPGGRVVVAGDDRQLPPVRAPHPATLDGREVGGSLYAFLRSVSAREFPLEETFRLNAPLAAFPERNFYAGAYRSADPARTARLSLRPGWEAGLEPWERVALDPRFPIVSLVHEGPSAATSNPFEAGIAARLARRLRAAGAPSQRTGETDDETFWRERLAIVSPHRAQNAEIRSALGGSAGSEPTVETVDRIQGKERDAVIASYCVTDPEFALAEASFIFGRERLNVTTTRARTKLILIVGRRLLDAVPGDDDDLAAAELLREYVYAGAEVGQATLAGPSGERVRVSVRVQGFEDDDAVLPTIEPARPLAAEGARAVVMTPWLQALLDAVRAVALSDAKYRSATFPKVERRLARRDIPFADWRTLSRLGSIALAQRSGAHGSFWVAEPLDPPRPPLAADAATVREEIEDVVIGARRRRQAPFYTIVRARFTWMDDAGEDVLLPVLEALAEEGRLVLARAPNGTLTVDLPDHRPRPEQDPEPAPARALSDGDFAVLNALEDLEAARINFGVVEAWASVADIAGQSGGRLSRRDVAAALPGLQAHEHVMSTDDGRVRSRMAEVAREIRYVKQRFAKGDADRRPHLVRSLKIELRDRRKPSRDMPLSTPIATLREGLGDIPSAIDALEILQTSLRRLWSAPDPGVAGFQARALVALTAAWHGREIPAELDGPADAFVITAETGSGKTEAACLPLLAGALADAVAGVRGTRAVLVYPRIRLAANQAQRLARYAAGMADEGTMPPLTIGLQNGNVPWDVQRLDRAAANGIGGWRRAAASGAYDFPFFPCPQPACAGALQMHPERGAEGADLLRCERCTWRYAGWIGTKRALQERPPSLFLPTTESLHQWLHDPRYGVLFGDTPGSSPPKALLADEIHLYTHGHGAQVGYTLRRLLARAASNDPAARPPIAVGMSATLGDPVDVWRQLVDRRRIRQIGPRPEEGGDNPRGREYFYFVQPEIESRGRDVAGASTTIQSLMCVAHGMRRRTGTDGGYRGIVFLDSIDRLRRMHGDYLDAEDSELASLRTRRYDDDPLTGDHRRECCGDPLGCDAFREGECWYFAATDTRQVGAQGRRMPGEPLVVAEEPISSATQGRAEDLIKGSDLVFATSSLEVGYDDPDIGLVYQHYSPLNLASFVQRKGRGGRGLDDRPVTAVTLSIHSHRDTWYFRRPATMLDTSGFGVPLNPANFFVRRGQVVATMLDAFASEEVHTGQPALDDRLTPTVGALVRAGDIVARTFGTDPCPSLGEPDLPTLWARAIGTLPDIAARNLPVLRNALPWVPDLLFAATGDLRVEVQVPDASRPKADETIGLALATVAPGNISRRFDGRHLHWIAPVQGDAPWLSEACYERASFFPTGGFDLDALLEALPEGAEREIGRSVHPKFCRPSTVQLATAGRMYGAEWNPAWKVSPQADGTHAVVPLLAGDDRREGVHHQSRGALRGFLLVRARSDLAQTRPRGPVQDVLARVEAYTGRGVSARQTGLTATRLYWGADAQVRPDDPQADTVGVTQRFTLPGSRDVLLHGYRVETEGVRFHLDTRVLDAFVQREGKRLADAGEDAWHRAQLLRHLVGSRAERAGINAFEARRAADLINTCAADRDLRARLTRILTFWDQAEFHRLLLDTMRAHLEHNPHLTERRINRLVEAAPGQEMQALLKGALVDARSQTVFEGYLRSLVLHGIAQRIKQSFVLLGHGDEREVLIHARLPIQFGARADDVVTIAEAGMYGDGTTRAFLDRWDTALAHWRDGFYGDCPNAREDALLDRVLEAPQPDVERWRALDPRHLEQMQGLAADLGGSEGDGGRMTSVVRTLFGTESIRGEQFEIFDLVREIRAADQDLVARFGRQGTTWETVSAAVREAADGRRPGLRRLLVAYGGLEDASHAEALSPESRLADQVQRLGTRLCFDGCQACLHQGSDLVSNDLIETATSRRVLARFVAQ